MLPSYIRFLAAHSGALAMMVSAALGPPLMGWMLDFGFAISTIMLGTAAYVLIAIVLLQPALTGPRATGGPG